MTVGGILVVRALTTTLAARPRLDLPVRKAIRPSARHPFPVDSAATCLVAFAGVATFAAIFRRPTDSSFAER